MFNRIIGSIDGGRNYSDKPNESILYLRRDIRYGARTGMKETEFLPYIQKILRMLLLHVEI